MPYQLATNGILTLYAVSSWLIDGKPPFCLQKNSWSFPLCQTAWKHCKLSSTRIWSHAFLKSNILTLQHKGCYISQLLLTHSNIIPRITVNVLVKFPTRVHEWTLTFLSLLSWKSAISGIIPFTFPRTSSLCSINQPSWIHWAIFRLYYFSHLSFIL